MFTDHITKQRDKYFKMNIHEINFQVVYFFNTFKIDYDVYLPSLGLNLQRDLVWNLDQKRELILSILFRRQIPRFAVIELNDETVQVIDGKQRLTAIKDFIDGRFALIHEGEEYYLRDLSFYHQRLITHYHLPFYIFYEGHKEVMPDSEKIFWFKMINFSGTPQDEEHLTNLNKQKD